MSTTLTIPVSAKEVRDALNALVNSNPALSALIATDLPTNGKGEITAVTLRGVLGNITPSLASEIAASLPSNSRLRISEATLQQVLNDMLAALQLTVVSTPSPEAFINRPYSQINAAQGGTPPYTYSVNSGALPDSCTLDPSTGIVSGVPTIASAFSYSILALDSSTPLPKSGSSPVAGAITPAPPAPLTLSSTPSVITRVGQNYSQVNTASGGTTPYNYYVSKGSLPPGTLLNSNYGLVSGVPTAGGAFDYTIAAYDSRSQSASNDISGDIFTGAAPVFNLGVNLPGYLNQIPPDDKHLAYFQSRGIFRFRLAVSWGLVQPTNFGPLNTTWVNGTLLPFLALAAARGMSALIDIHNYGKDATGINKLGTSSLVVGGVTYNTDPAALGDLWGKIAAATLGNSAVYGFDLMNEWSQMDPTDPNDSITGATPYSKGVVLAATQSAINAIRAVDMNRTIYIENLGYSGAWTYQSYGSWMTNLIDPGNNWIASVHAYPDPDSSGTNLIWSSCVSIPGVAPPGLNTSVNILVERFSLAQAWIVSNGWRMHIGETAVGDDDPNWNICLDNFLSWAQANNIEVSYWAGQGFPVNYGYSIDGTNGFQTKQMVIVDKYTGYSGPQPTAYFLNFQLDTPFPVYGTAGVASPAITVDYRGKLLSPVTITFHAKLIDGTAASGTFSAPTVTLQPGLNALDASVTYTPAANETAIISTTNSVGWTDPPSFVYTSKVDLFNGLLNLAGQPVTIRNIFDIRQQYAPYVGPACTLKRASDGASMQFTRNVLGNLPRQAIQDWASSRLIEIIEWFDQSPAANHLTTVFGTGPMLNLQNAAGYPEIDWALGNGMQFNSPTYGQTGQTFLGRLTLGNGGPFVRQDWFNGPFGLQSGHFYVTDSSSTSLSLGLSSTITSCSFTYESNTTGGAVTYNSGSPVASANTPAFTFSPAFFNSLTQMGYFVFFTSTQWSGTWQEAIFLDSPISVAKVQAFQAADAAYYSTPLPDTLSAVNPLITGTGSRGVIAGHTSEPFFSFAIADGNAGATDSLTITLSGSGAGTLAGTGLIGSGPYTMASASPATLTTQMQALVFTPSSGTGTSVTMTVVATSSASTSSSDANTVVSVKSVAPAETPLVPGPGSVTTANYWGVNFGGAEANPNTTRPYGYDYFWPQNSEIDYYINQGFGLFRITLDIRRMQPQSYGALAQSTGGFSDPPLGQLGELKRIVDHCLLKGVRVLLDPHNFGFIVDTFNGNLARLVGTDSEGTAQFVDYHQRMATVWKNYPNVIFGLMNEPHVQTAAQWFTGATAAINAIAAITTTQPVSIPGTSYQAAYSWTSSGNGAAWHAYAPPAGLSIFFEAHQYLDSDSSGTHAACVAFSSQLTQATSWGRTEGVKFLLGEMGWSTDPTCATPGAAAVAYLAANSDVWAGGTYWLGGTYLFYSSYVYIPVTYASGGTVPNGNKSQLTDWLTLI